LAKTWQFPSLFYEAKRICLHLLKVAGAVENFKNAQGSSPVFVLSNHTTFSQTQTGATVPLTAQKNSIQYIYLIIGLQKNSKPEVAYIQIKANLFRRKNEIFLDCPFMC
jgi:hypothetical protein